MKESNKLTPINDAWWQSFRMRFDIPLPSWVEDQRIGIDLKRTKRLMNLGGISFTRVEASKHQDKTVSMPTVVGVAPDGSAYAGKIAASERVPTYDLDQHTNDANTLIQNAVWTNIKISLNLEEIKERIQEKDENMREAESWTPHLDKALREGIRKGGTEHLLKGHSKGRLLFALLVNVHNSLMDSFNVSAYDAVLGNKPQIPSVGELANEFGFTFAFFSLWGLLITNRKLRKQEGSGYRISLLPGYEIDRALGLQLLARTLPLIKPIEPGNDESWEEQTI